MTTYTGIADSNGNFNILFSSNYTGGQKVTVTAEKDLAQKTIELFAPSSVTGGGIIQFSGNMTNFPQNVGDIILSNEISGAISSYAMSASNQQYNIFRYATGLIINGDITSIGINSFADWRASTKLIFNGSIPTSIGNFAFSQWNALLELVLKNGVQAIGQSSFQYLTACTKVDLPASVTSIGSAGFSFLTNCLEFICRATTPPTAGVNFLSNLNASCIIKVPAASVAAYQAAPNWSSFAARIQAI